MDKKKLVLLIGALIVAVGTAMVARSMFAGAGAPSAEAAAKPQQGPKVLVAQRALPVGTIITADAFKFQDWPDELVQDAYFIEGEADLNALMGTVVRFPVTAGQPLTKGALVSPKDRGFLAAALAPGMRAVTVPVSDKTGVAGFVFPGDRVDMVLTQTIDGDDNQKLNSAETILQNVRVLATDQSTTQEKNDKGETVVKTSETVTLEVTPVMAEEIAVAQSFGTLSLSLRSLADTNGGVEEALASGDIRIPPNATPEEEQRILRQFATRPVDSRGSYSTGGDVSRFQRRTLPPRGADRETQNVRAYGEAVAGTLADRMGVPASGAASGQAVPTGPIVRIARGNEVTVVSVK